MTRFEEEVISVSRQIIVEKLRIKAAVSGGVIFEDVKTLVLHLKELNKELNQWVSGYARGKKFRCGVTTSSLFSKNIMFIQCDLEKMSLRSLYELMTFKTGEFQAIRNHNGNYKEQQSEIALLQRVINDKKVKPINPNPNYLVTA